MFFTVKQFLEYEDQTKFTHFKHYLIYVETSDLIQTNQVNEFCWNIGLKPMLMGILYTLKPNNF